MEAEGGEESLGKPDPTKRPRPITPKIFKKCKSATFTLDGTSYTIGKSGGQWSMNLFLFRSTSIKQFILLRILKSPLFEMFLE